MHHQLNRVPAVIGAGLLLTGLAGLAGSAAPRSSWPGASGRGRAVIPGAAEPLHPPASPPGPGPGPRPAPGRLAVLGRPIAAGWLGGELPVQPNASLERIPAVGVSLSHTYAVFNGGGAQTGIHGQDEPWSLGHPVAHQGTLGRSTRRRR